MNRIEYDPVDLWRGVAWVQQALLYGGPGLSEQNADLPRDLIEVVRKGDVLDNPNAHPVAIRLRLVAGGLAAHGQPARARDFYDLASMLLGEFIAPVKPERGVPAKVADCLCYHSCGENPATGCSLSGRWHVHAGEPCPVHLDAPGDR